MAKGRGGGQGRGGGGRGPLHPAERRAQGHLGRALLVQAPAGGDPGPADPPEAEADDLHEGAEDAAPDLDALLAAPAPTPTDAEPVPGVLYLIPTPLGHLGDLSPRARAVLAGVELLLCEDTRVSRRLTAHLDVHPRLLSCHAHNERGRAPQVVALLQAGRRVGLVSDAGTPLVSDPGDSVVQAVLDAGLPVVALPGPCAALTALSASGLPAGRFQFVGFLPRAKAERRAALAALRSAQATLLLYESPHRLIDALDDLVAELGPTRRASLAHNLTKRSERHLRGPLAALLAQLRVEVAAAPVAGEWCMVVEGAPAVVEAPPPPDQAAQLRLAAGLLAAGLGAKVARGLIQSTFGLSKNDAYAIVLNAQGEQADTDERPGDAPAR